MEINIHPSSNTGVMFPRGDDQSLEYGHVNLWVISRLFTDDGRQVEACRVVESKELLILRLDEQAGQFVRYKRHYYRLHSSDEFVDLIEGARNYRYYFFNRGMQGHADSIQLTSIAPFIFLDESEPVYM